MKKGFIGIALLIGTAIASLALSGYAVYKMTHQNLGATVYTTQLTDTMNTFRLQTNSSTANLNTDINSISSTINAYGNITAENTPLRQTKGGTGLTVNPTDSQYLGSNGASSTWKSFVGSTGITITTSTTSTVIGTAGFDNTANISFTGNNTHTGSEAFASTTQFGSSTVTFNTTGQVIDNASTSFANAPTINTWKNNPSSTATYGQISSLFNATSAIANITPAQNVETVLQTMTVPAMKTNDEIVIQSFVTLSAQNTATSSIYINGTLACAPTGTNTNYYIQLTLKNLASTTSQVSTCDTRISNGALTAAVTSASSYLGITSFALGSTFTVSSTVNTQNASPATYTQQLLNSYLIKD